MKFKGKILIYMVMITLSLSVMFYGVFAAMNASLQVNGQLAFEAHECEGTAKVLSVEGALAENGTKYVLAEADATKTINWQDSATLSLTNPIYLDDISTRDSNGNYINEDVKIAPIVITLQMTNTSKFSVKTVAKSNVQLQTADETPVNITGLSYSYPEIELDANESINTFTITITTDSDLITSPINITSFALTVDIIKFIS